MATPTRDTRDRFTGRVADYVRARPGYPPAIVDDLTAVGILFPGAAIADVGSGTGISTEHFLAQGFEVVGVEPNAPMRSAAEATLARYPRFRSQPGSAEATGLPDESVDLIVAAQAFHWFDAARTRGEFRRILKPSGWLALIWNARRSTGTAFLEAYENLLLEFGTDYAQVGHRGVGGERLGAFFGGPFTTRRYDNRQELDLAGLRSRLLSSSYIPAAGEAAHAAMLECLAAIFTAHAVDGRVEFVYDTEVHCGRLPAG
ncbi:MAG: class I SAM-dependent methyltransferase [Thermoanaerobaculia bacterium]